MKKLIVIIIVLFTINNYLIGQSILGFGCGSNYPDLYDAKNSDKYYNGGKYHSYISYAFEINYIRRHEKLINYGLSVSYLSRIFNMNSSITQHNYNKEIDAHFKLGYISFAFLPEIAYGNKFRFFFDFGPCLDLLVNGSQSGNNYSEGIITTPISVYVNRTDYKVSDTFNNFLIGLKSGLGLDYPLTKKIIFQFSTNVSAVINNFVGGENSAYFSTHCINISFLGGFSYKFIK